MNPDDTKIIVMIAICTVAIVFFTGLATAIILDVINDLYKKDDDTTN